MKFLPSLILVGTLTIAEATPAVESTPPVSRVYSIRQTVVLKEIPKDAKLVRLWISIPGDTTAQRVLDFSLVTAPGAWRVLREKEHGGRFLYVEVASPGTNSLTTVADFTVQRHAVHHALDAAAGNLSESVKGFFVDELRRDAPHMEVTAKISRLAEAVCGRETNLVIQARQLLNFVATNTAHYSKDATKPRCSVGDAESCLSHGGGCCTDIHSLFIALARARGIPARLQMGYRLKPQNAGIEADPGYRCWPEYFIPGNGWVPADIVEASAAPDVAGRDRWFSGLDERRVHLNEGREFDLSPRQSGPPVNTMVIGFAEIDGVQVRVLPEGDRPAQLVRTVNYTERAGSARAVEIRHGP